MPGLISGEPLRVLLVSASTGLYEEVGAALTAGVGEIRYFWVSQPDLALVRGQGLAPHIILVDGEQGDATGLVRQLGAGVSEAAILVLVPAGAQGLALAQAAMLAGAGAFLPKPVQPDDLVATLRQLLGRRAAPVEEAGPATGRVIVFCGPKGGTGRTTLAINTAVSLKQAIAERVVLVDADYAAPAIDVALNLRGQRDIRALLPKLSQLDADLVSSVLVTHSSGVKVLLAPQPDETQPTPSLPQVQQVVAWLRRMFPWVLVDLGLPLDETAYAFLDLADRVVVSIIPEMVALRNAKLMLAQFAARGYPQDKAWPLLNREGLGGGLARHEVEAVLGRPVRYAVPNDQILATETINSGVPMVISHRRRPVVRAYRGLAAELVADRPATAQALPAAGPASAAPQGGPIPAAAAAQTIPAAVPASAAPRAAPAVKPSAAAQPAPAASEAARPAGPLARGRRLRPVLTRAAIVSAIVLLFALVTPWLIQRASRLSDSQARAAATLAPAPGATPAASEPATLAPSPSAAPASTATPSAAPSASATATSAPPTATPSQTATASPAPTATPLPSQTPTATVTPVPTQTATRLPTITPTPVLSQPALSSPYPNETAGGVVTFGWQPTGPLPEGAAYEVVWWNDNEDPSAARGIAPPTREASLAADLDVLYKTGQLRTSILRWTVLIVRTEPYARLTQPSAGTSYGLMYRQPAGEPPPPPPKP